MIDEDYELAVVAAMRNAKQKDVRKMRLTFGGELLLKYMVAQGLVTAPDADGNRHLTPKGKEFAARERADLGCAWPGCRGKIRAAVRRWLGLLQRRPRPASRLAGQWLALPHPQAGVRGAVWACPGFVER